MHKIIIRQKFDQPIAEIFELFSKFETYNKIFYPFQLKSIVTSNDPLYPDGIDAIRIVSLGRLKLLKEQIVAFKQNQYIHYKIIQNKWFTHHIGRIEFQQLKENQTEITYTIELSGKIPASDYLILAQLKIAITLGMKKLAKSLN